MVLDAFILYRLTLAGMPPRTTFELGLIVLVLAPFWAMIAGAIGDRKDVGRAGVWLGGLCGAMGVLLTLVLTGARRKCPWCRLLISTRATVCPHCTEPVSPTEEASAR